MDAAQKAYHRFWAEGRILGKPAEDAEALPLWLKAVAVVTFGAVYFGMYLLLFWFVSSVWFKVQNAHVDWCAEAGGKMSVGAFGYVSCYDLTPKKSEKP